MGHAEKAEYLFNQGFSWAQAILAGFGEQYGLDRETAFTLARAFGSGMGRGGICGALIGAFMILGFKFQGEKDEHQARYKTYDLVKEFIERFERSYGTIVCKELLGGVNLATEDGRCQARKRKLFTTICPKLVQGSADILEKML